MNDIVKAEVPALVAWEEPQWSSFEGALELLRKELMDVTYSLGKFMWLVGSCGKKLQESSEYGDSYVDKLCEGLNRKKTWVYECIRLHDVYTKEQLLQFMVKGVPPSSVARLAAIKDDSARNYVEDKLVKGEIYYDDITKTKKEYEDRINDTEHSHSERSDGEEPSMEEIKAEKRAGEDSPDSKASSSIRSYFGSGERKIDELMYYFDDKFYAAIDKLDDIADEGLYELSTNRMESAGMRMIKLRDLLDNHIGTIGLHCPDVASAGKKKEE